jgi:hypothetical protein
MADSIHGGYRVKVVVLEKYDFARASQPALASIELPSRAPA